MLSTSVILGSIGTREHYVSLTLIGINRGYDKRYNASAVTHELPEETKSAIHNRRIKSLTLQPGDRRLIIKTRWLALSSAFFRLRVTPVTSARRYRASSVINVKTVFAVVLRSRNSVLFHCLLLSLFLRVRARCRVRKPETRKNRDNRRNCGKSTRATALSEQTQWYRRVRKTWSRTEKIATLETGHASAFRRLTWWYIDSYESSLNSRRTLCCARIVAGRCSCSKNAACKNPLAKDFYFFLIPKITLSS